MQQLEVKPAEMDPSMVGCLAIKQCDDIFECYQNARHGGKSAMAALEVIVGRWWRIFDDWEGFQVLAQEADYKDGGRLKPRLFMLPCQASKS